MKTGSYLYRILRNGYQTLTCIEYTAFNALKAMVQSLCFVTQSAVQNVIPTGSMYAAAAPLPAPIPHPTLHLQCIK